MKTLITFKTKWGSTQQYATWLAEALPQADLLGMETVTPMHLSQYDLVIIGSRTYMGHIEAQEFMVKNWEILKTKKVYLFVVGMLAPDSPESKQAFELIPLDIREGLVGYMKLPGKVDSSKLTLVQKLIAKTQKLAGRPEINREALNPIISALAAYQ